MHLFFRQGVSVGNACCFRLGRVAKRNGGGLFGRVCLVGAFAKETIGVAWFNSERTPLGVQGLVEEEGTVECRRPLGLRANGCGSLMMRRCLLLIGNMLRAGSR